jgi:hypothetical protein
MKKTYKVNSDSDLMELQKNLGDCAVFTVKDGFNDEPVCLADLRYFADAQPDFFPLVITAV